MKKAAALLTAAVLLAAFTAGCGAGNSAGSPGKKSGVVNVFNWGEYIDESIFDDFEKETGIRVEYNTFSDNESMYAVLKTGASHYDVIIPSDYMISRLISENMLEKLDFKNIPNFSQIDDSYKNLDYDPANEYSVPYMTGIVGLIYNSSLISEDIVSWDALFDETYAGQILMFSNPRDAMASRFFASVLSTPATRRAQRGLRCCLPRSRWCRPTSWIRSSTSWRAAKRPWDRITPAII